MFAYTYNKKIENKRGAEAPLLIICFKNYYFLPLGAKKEHTITKTTKPTNPPWPKPLTRDVKFAITSIPNTEVPASTYHKIDTGTNAKKSFPRPPKKSDSKLNTFSIFLDLID